MGAGTTVLGRGGQVGFLPGLTQGILWHRLRGEQSRTHGMCETRFRFGEEEVSEQELGLADGGCQEGWLGGALESGHGRLQTGIFSWAHLGLQIRVGRCARLTGPRHRDSDESEDSRGTPSPSFPFPFVTKSWHFSLQVLQYIQSPSAPSRPPAAKPLSPLTEAPRTAS